MIKHLDMASASALPNQWEPGRILVLDQIAFVLFCARKKFKCLRL